MVTEHGCSEIAEHRHIAPDLRSYSLRQFDSASFNHDIYILARTAQETITDISSYDKGTDTELGCRLGYYRKYLMVKKTLCYCC